MSRSAAPTEAPASFAGRRGSRSAQAGLAARDDVARLPRTALAYAARCHAGQRRESDGAPFLGHLSEVARLLRDAGCSDRVVAAGLLHAVVQDTDVGADELAARFGAAVVELVLGVTDCSVGSFPQRRQALRAQVAAAGGDTALLFAADEIAEVRELAAAVRRERSRPGAAAIPQPARDRLERFQRLSLEQHRASLAMLGHVAPGHRLVRQLAAEIRACPLTARASQHSGGS